MHMGAADEHTVFEAEVTGAILALDIIRATPRLTSADIFMECYTNVTVHTHIDPAKYLMAVEDALD